ncbi:hypothetical protein GQX73_g2573 [Xylaria multiplex]|uniref:Uncharacterized protein n=1 Tax=Xylaria multiplex TaxID=323545 RepID=A0A7C8MUX9_9PEZI|nr:hypothetical protein GQX73_g2573 [Xylaria multiplex]
MPEKRSGGAVPDADDGGRDGRRVRIIRSLGMSDDEWEAREQRRINFLSDEGIWGEEQGGGKKSSNNTPKVVEGQTEVATEDGESGSAQQPPVRTVESQERKPWESLVIGDLGENLSHIERKNREIEQQRFIVQFHEEHSPHQVDHNKNILNQLIRERAEMDDNEENNMPQDQREKSERISKRLELLQRVLDSSKCEDEKINVRAAIQGYESGQISFSHDFTLLYAGRVVDKCPTYESFCVDRDERLDRYFARYGPGWLWQEPPLAGTRNDALGMKGLCLERDHHNDRYGIGRYEVNLKFTVQRDKVSKGKLQPYTHQTNTGNITKQDSHASCRLRTLLDSGATFPIIVESDLARLNVDVSKYSAQGIMIVNALGGPMEIRFYEMYVSVCTPDDESLVGKGDMAVWPTEPRLLGGFCPVLVQGNPRGKDPLTHRLSGMIPFDACYLSSAPSLARIWLGEDRRDVLGTSRLPAHLRFDSDNSFIFQYPREFDDLRLAARTPDRVIFTHQFPDNPNTVLIDSDVANTPGKSELAIGRYQTVSGKPGQEPSRKLVPHRIIQVEPRKGDIKVVPKKNPRPWRGIEKERRRNQRY